MKIQGKEMEVKILLCYLKMILENDQNNILEATILMFVVHTFFCEVVILRVFHCNKTPVFMPAFVFQQIPLIYIEMKSKLLQYNTLKKEILKIMISLV